MDNEEQPLESPGQISKKRSPVMRLFRWCIGICATLFLLSGLMLGGLYLRLQQGPFSFPGLSSRVVAAMSSYFASDLKIDLEDSAIELANGSFALRIRGLEMLNSERQVQLRAPDTVVSVDTLSLLFGRLHPRMIEFIDLQVVGTVNDDGSITIVPEDRPEGLPAKVDPETPVVVEPATPVVSDRRQSRLSRGVKAFLDIVAGTDGPLGVLDRAQFTNLRLTLIDVKRDVRTHFSRIDVKFERSVGGGRTFDAHFNALQGPWTLKGEVTPQGNGYRTTLNMMDAPVQDMLVLSGLSTVPAASTLELSGLAELVLDGDVLSRFEGSFSTGEGRIDVHDPDATPLFVNSSFFDLNWDETTRKVNIRRLEFQAGETHFFLTGDASIQPGEPWKLTLSADQATLSGAAPGDKPITVDRFDGVFDGRNGVINGHLLVKGPALDADVTVQIGAGEDAAAVAVDGIVTGTAARSVLRLWPEIVASAPRRYLVDSLKGGLVQNGIVKVRMSGDLVRSAMKGGAMPEEALLVDVSIADGELLPTAGLPPLTKMTLSAKVGGRTATAVGHKAVMSLSDGRSLKIPVISFNLGDFYSKDAIGVISADIEGGADAVAAFLQLPKIREAIKWNINPSDLKGKAALKLVIDLPVRNIPKFQDLPVSVTGRLSEVTLNNAAGTEKLDKGAFTIDYNRGTLALKGDGQLAGAPASISVTQQANGEGSGVFLFSLDDAARVRKGMEFGSQLTGTIPLKVTLALGKDAGDRYHVEADLAKVAINNLLPGWVKASGRPGKLSFIASKSENSLDIRELAVESGNVRFSGQARLAKDGAFESAELSNFQLSQGDDMQVKVDKPGDTYRAVIRGNLGDARPIIRSFSDTSNGNARNSRNSGSGLNVDIDAAINILTGFNDESLTKTVLKAAIRNSVLRQLSLTGRLGSTQLTAQTSLKNNTTYLNVHADDAGSFLRFLDIYRRMTDGDIFFETALGEGPQNGYAMARNFVIRNESALRRIIPTQTQGTGSRRIDVNDAPFTKARVDFTRAGSRVDFHDAAIWGAHVGFTLDGYLDFQRSRLDVSGTFVPAYGLNNAFAQVPLFGQILGGGQYGGLFGVNFRLTGPISSPDVNVNPLSAVAPGIFRKLFGAGSGPNAPELPDDQNR